MEENSEPLLFVRKESSEEDIGTAVGLSIKSPSLASLRNLRDSFKQRTESVSSQSSNSNLDTSSNIIKRKSGKFYGLSFFFF